MQLQDNTFVSCNTYNILKAIIFLFDITLEVFSAKIDNTIKLL
jgi:hypothetical protein